MRLPRAPAASASDYDIRRHNYWAVQWESAGLGVVNASSVFLPVFLIRLGGTNLEISLLSALPAISGFLLAIPMGSFLQSRRNIIPWYAGTRAVQFLVYGLTAIAVALVPADMAVVVVLFLWGLFTLPSTASAVASNGMLNGVAGPSGRYDLLSRRYGIMGLTTAITIAVVGQVLELIGFALNYQVAFLAFSAAGLVACWFSFQLRVPDHEPVVRPPDDRWRRRLTAFMVLLGGHRPFLLFIARLFVLTFGISIATPLIPLWYIREANASDVWIGIIGTSQSLAMLGGYYTWRRLARRISTRRLFVASTIGIALYPAAMVLSRDLAVVTAVTALGAFVGAGLNLVLFDELMKTIPNHEVVTFTGVQTSLSNVGAIVAPLLGGILADLVGIGPGLLVAAAVSAVGGFLLLLPRAGSAPAPA